VLTRAYFRFENLAKKGISLVVFKLLSELNIFGILKVIIVSDGNSPEYGAEE